MFNQRRPAYLLVSLILGLTTVACDTTAPTAAPVPSSASAVPATPTGAGTATTAVLPSLPPSELASPTASAISGAPSTGVTAVPATTTLPVATQAPATPTALTAPPPVVAQAPPATPAPTEQALAPEQNPAGDIPDTQAFITYRSTTGGYDLDVPEGWARSENGPTVGFIEKLNGETVTITDTAAAPTAATARTAQVAALQQSPRAVQVTSVKDVQLPGGAAVLIDYTSNSEPNAVTGKQVRLENNSYLFYHSGKLATVTVWAPLGADNVDQWQRIAHSFRWR